MVKMDDTTERPWPSIPARGPGRPHSTLSPRLAILQAQQQLASSNGTNAALEAEIGSISEAFEQVERDNRRLLAQVQQEEETHHPELRRHTHTHTHTH